MRAVCKSPARPIRISCSNRGRVLLTAEPQRIGADRWIKGIGIDAQNDRIAKRHPMESLWPAYDWHHTFDCYQLTLSRRPLRG